MINSKRFLLKSRSATESRQAYETLVRPWIDALYRTALRLTGDSHEAEDLVQDTCLKAYRAIDRIQSGINAKAWLFQILTNTFIDSRRRMARSPFVDVGNDGVDLASSGTTAQTTQQQDPEVHVLYRSFRREAFLAMAELPTDVRIVVSLSLLEQFSYREIAEVVGCPVGTVRSRLNRGRQQLRNALRDFLPGDTGSGDHDGRDTTAEEQTT